jgi:hypothetical protein
MRRFFVIVVIAIPMVGVALGVFFIRESHQASLQAYRNAHEPAPIWRISSVPADRAYSTLNKSRVILLPSKANFAVPEKWLPPHRLYEDNLALSPEQIENVANGVCNETSSSPCFEFASVTNSIFPFDRCAATLGQFRWNSGGNCLRVYDLAEPLEEVTTRIEERGLAELKRLAKSKRNSEGKNERSQYGKWSRIQMSFWWGHDPTHPHGVGFDFYAQQVNNRTFAYCFLSTHEEWIVEILNSVEFPVGK